MRALFLFFIACFPMAFCFCADSPGLISESFGIVTRFDLNSNLMIAGPRDAFGDPFLVWQCLRVKKLKMHCENMGDYAENGGKSATPILSVLNGDSWLEFYFPHVWGKDRCEEDLKIWKKILKSGNPACFSGYYDKETHFIGNLLKIKTKLGEWSYFTSG